MEMSELEGRLRHWLGSRYGHPGKADRGRRLLRAHEMHAGLILAIKANSNRKSNVRQYRALRSMSERTQDCVTPIELDGSDRFYSMGWIDAPLLDTRLGSGRETALAQAGDWLARLQAATSGRPSPGSTPHVLRPAPMRGKGAIRVTADRLRRRMRRPAPPRSDSHAARRLPPRQPFRSRGPRSGLRPQVRPAREPVPRCRTFSAERGGAAGPRCWQRSSVDRKQRQRSAKLLRRMGTPRRAGPAAV